MRSIVSFLFMFLIVLIIIEKSTKEKNIDQQLFANTEFRNISPKDTQKLATKQITAKRKNNDDLFSDNNLNNVEEEIIQELLETSKRDMENDAKEEGENLINKEEDSTNTTSLPNAIPVYDINTNQIPPIQSVNNIEKNDDINAQEINIYFLKFYGNGKKSHSRLIKVKRQAVFDSEEEKVNAILSFLKAGPLETENSQGTLNSIPKSLELTEPYKIQNQILYLSFNSDFEFGAGPEILKDRIDQVAYSFIDNIGIKGIELAINGKKIKQIGGTGLAVPDIIVKNPRKVVTL